MDKQKMIYLPLKNIKPYENNPRKNDKAVDKVAASLKEFGAQAPIIVDANYVIIAGHTRYKAAKKLGWEEFPCVVADGLTEEQAKAYRLADNKTGEFAEWDDEQLAKEIADILEINMEDFGFAELESAGEGDFENYGADKTEITIFKHRMKVDKTVIPLTDEEFERLNADIEEYLSLNRTILGYIRSRYFDD